MNSHTLIDTHVHFWEPAQFRLDWLSGVPVLDAPCLPDDYFAAVAPAVVERLVFVQAGVAAAQAYAEAAWVTALAVQSPQIAAVVAFAALDEGAIVRAALERLAGLSLVRGIRQVIQGEPAGFVLQPAFVTGVSTLAELGFSFDVCLDVHQLPEVIQLVRLCPNVQFVLNHIGNPGGNVADWEGWRRDIRLLGGYDNVVCKVSGVLTQYQHAAHAWAVFPDHFAHLLETFGTQRLMFGSDYPVVNLAGDVRGWFTLLESVAAQLSDTERAHLFWQTGARCYGLEKAAS